MITPFIAYHYSRKHSTGYSVPNRETKSKKKTRLGKWIDKHFDLSRENVEIALMLLAAPASVGLMILIGWIIK